MRFLGVSVIVLFIAWRGVCLIFQRKVTGSGWRAEGTAFFTDHDG